MPNGKRLTVIVPALNEESNLEPAVETILDRTGRWFDDYELLIFNDGSNDRTGEVAEKIASSCARVRVFHNEKPKSLGGVYKEGLKHAGMEYIILINGKNDAPAESLDAIFSLCGKADMIVPYTINIHDRPVLRRLCSSAFTFILNAIFRLDIKYYNHSVLHRSEIVKPVVIRTDSYAFQAEALIKLIKKGRSFIEVGVHDRFRKETSSKAFRMRNFIGVIRFFFSTVRDVYFS